MIATSKRLFAGGIPSAAASLAHLGRMGGGAAWYRCAGAGEHMARQVERGGTGIVHAIRLYEPMAHDRGRTGRKR